MIRLGDRAQMACCVARKTRVRAPVFTMPLFPAAAARPPAESISRCDLRGRTTPRAKLPQPAGGPGPQRHDPTHT